MRTIDADELQQRLHEEARDCYNNQQYGIASGLAIAQQLVIDSKTVKSKRNPMCGQCAHYIRTTNMCTIWVAKVFANESCSRGEYLEDTYNV